MFKRITCSLLPFILIWIQCFFCLNAQAAGGRPSSAQSPTQQSTGTQSTQEVTALEEGKPVERAFAEGQKHSYQITLAEGQYFKVEIKQLGMDVRVSLQQPGGRTTWMVDIPQTRPEVAFERVAESAGIYRLDLYARRKAPAGRYEIRIVQLRPATEDERALQQARKLFDEFFRLHRDGKYVEARPSLIRALEIRERVLGPEHLEIADTLGYLGNNYALTGDYASSEPIRQRSLKIKEKVFGPDHPDMAGEFYSLGTFYDQKGDSLKAEEMFQKALGIFEKTHRMENLTVASVLANLGDVYYDRSDYEKAGGYYQRALVIREKLMGPDHFHLAASITSIGRAAYDAGDYLKAEKSFQRSLTLAEKALGPDHIQLTGNLNDLAMLYTTTGDYAKAETFYQRAMSIHEKAGITGPNAQETLFGLARLYAARGRPSEAVKFQSRASELEERFVGLNLAVGSEREKLVFLNKLSLRSSRNISLHADLAADNSTARDLSVTTILQRKGRVQDALSNSLASLRNRFGGKDQALLDRLSASTSQLARLVLSEPQGMSLADHRKQIKALEEEREKIEGEISSRSAGFYQQPRPVTLAGVRSLIPDHAALIELAVYRPFDPKANGAKAFGEPRFVAYVLRRQGEAQWRELGAAKEIDGAVGALRQALRDPHRRRDVRELARVLDEKVMRPVRVLLGDATQLLISPDGALNLIPFEALVNEQGQYLIQRYSFTYLTSGRDLQRMQLARESRSEPLVVADPSFGKPVTERIARMGKASKTTVFGGRRRRSVTNARGLSEVYFAPLGGTAREGETIKRLFPEANLLSGAQATESALKQTAAPRMLHIATHGFFLEDVGGGGTAAAAANIQLATRGLSANARIENPLLRSGLALAGANLRSGAANDDGILTALEASGLNLWGTKLVVLSACDTGLGEVRNGEGVYGLRRAFVLAGAESLVMSLWPVSDYSTRNLMASYYRDLKRGMGRGESLRQVQLDLLKRNAQLHPFYWANFIQSGEWANLDGKR